eukprot:gene8351-biopygen12134
MALSRCWPCCGAADARAALAGEARSASALAQVFVGPAAVMRVRARPEQAQRRPRPCGRRRGGWGSCTCAQTLRRGGCGYSPPIFAAAAAATGPAAAGAGAAVRVGPLRGGRDAVAGLRPLS